MRPVLATLALLSLALPATAGAQAGVSIGGFETDGSVGLSRTEYQAVGRALGALLGTRLGSFAGARVVPITPLPERRPGRVDLSAARSAASAAGARLLVVGSLLDQYGDIQVEARIIDAATGQPVAVVRGDPSLVRRDQLAEAIAALAERLAAEPRIGATPGGPTAVGIPVNALVQFGMGLGYEEGGDRTKAAAAYRAALEAAPGFTEATAALRRVGG